MSERSLLDKLGVKPLAKVSVLGVELEQFAHYLQERTDDVSHQLRKDSDMIIFATGTPRELDRLGKLKGYLKPNGVIWVIRPKGQPDFKEADIIRAAKAQGLVDNKICSFSDSLSAMRVVIPLADRPAR